MNRLDCCLIDSLGVEDAILINVKEKVFLIQSSYEDDYEVWLWIEYSGHEDMVKNVLDSNTTIRELIDTCKFKVAYRYYNDFDNIKLMPDVKPFGFDLPTQDSYIPNLVLNEDELEELKASI